MKSEMSNSTIENDFNILSASQTFYDIVHESSEESGNLEIIVIILGLLYSVILVVGFIGNAGVLLIYLRNRKIRSPTNRFIAHLSVSDLLVIVFCVPAALLNNFNIDWISETLTCKFLSYFQGVSIVASIFTLIAISIDRSKAIAMPLTYRLDTRIYRCILLLIWIISLIVNIPWLIVFNLEKHKSKVTCMEMWPTENFEKYYFVIANLIICYLGPIVVLVICYSIILRVVVRRKTLHHNSAEMYQRNKVKALKMVVTLIVTFTLTWFPLYTLICLYKFTDISLEAFNWLFPFFQCLGTSNSAINPLLYVYLSPKFKHEFKKFFQKPNSYSIPNEINLVSLKQKTDA